MNRRHFLQTSTLASASLLSPSLVSKSLLSHLSRPSHIQTVSRRLRSKKMGLSLTHEHLLVDFIGAKETGSHRWDREEVKQVVLPYLLEIKEMGVKTFVDCTPNYIGRDVLLLKELAEETGLNILTNTGLYGAVNNKFLPEYAFTETAAQLADRWTAEYEEGIEGTGIKPGFMKIGVNPDSLSALHQKLVRAAALTHLRTGLTIASHTGPSLPAYEELAILEQEGVHPSAFIWVHAQNEPDLSQYLQAAKSGAWISLDGVGENNTPVYLEKLQFLRQNKLLSQVLLSHDAGWYSPGEENGGNFKGYTSLFEHLLPALQEAGFSQPELDQMLIDNPRRSLAIRVRSF